MANKLIQTIGQRLIERLDYFTMQPQRVLDVGCGAGFFTTQLVTRYPAAEVIGLDTRCQRLKESEQKHPAAFVCADLESLPFADESFDLVFANQIVHWSTDWAALLAELQRVIRPGGCLMFSVLGLDSYREIPGVHVLGDPETMHALFDMHPIGDALLAAEWLDPVVDMHRLVARYASCETLLQSLHTQGLDYSQRQTLPSTPISVTYEVIYAQAWRREPRQTHQGTDIFVPIEVLRKSRNQGGIV